MDPVIKQILPIPESLTAMIRCETENGKKYYVKFSDSLRIMSPLKTQLFKELCNGLRVLRDDLRVKGCDLHFIYPPSGCAGPG